ncbi:MAG: hypothetical protein AAFW59_02685 [Pseudomonadota bacterium]
MEILGGIVLSIFALVLLAALGLSTVMALALMAVFGLLSNWSFKRIFFLSFFLGLSAPILLGMATYSAFEDGSLERDLRAELGDVINIPEERVENWRESLDELREIGEEVDRGELTEEQAEERIRLLFSGQDNGVTIDLDGVEADENEDAIRIQID